MALRSFTLTIKQRLIALIVLSIVVIVGSLTIYFTSREIREISDNLRSTASSYADLVGKQAMSAVAFSDRETAREVVASIVTDPDLDSVMLIGAHGETLYAHGTPTPWVATAGSIAKEVETSSRITTLTPVISLEGPRGTLVLEFSTRRIAAARAHLMWTAIGTGGAALGVAVLLAWLIARGLARRLRVIADVATAVAGGDLTQQLVEDTRDDEIGALAAAFNAMLSQIKQLIRRVRDLARQEQARLETLVAERTAALDARTNEMRLVFDHVDQGLLVVDLDGTIAREHSGAVERWLGPIPESHSLVDFVRAFAPAKADWFGLMWSALAEDVLPLELCVVQLPSKFVVDGRSLQWAYQPFVTATGATRLLVKISDVTAEVERQRSERDERETTSMVSRLLRDRAGFIACRDEAVRLVAEVAEGGADLVAFLRAVHTLKGMSALLELLSISEACHALESAHAEADERAVRELRVDIAHRWQFLDGKLGPLLRGVSDQLDLVEDDLVQLESAIGKRASYDELARVVAMWRNERATRPLERLADQARAFAVRLGKGPIDVRVEVDPELRLPATLAPFWSSFSHAVRNAIDHGLEPSEERVTAGKPAGGAITLRASSVRGGLVVELADDGRGIQWERIAEAARNKGLPAATHDDLVEALFHDGLSTRDQVTETSGRGIGLGALRTACQTLGGRVSLSTTAGLGTTLRFSWPSVFPRTFSRPLVAIP
ncbi:MAG TPA: HAMP domain-containing protein [Kofleriaceae bacterium]|jgi:two-component system chemotaxis sensor kinase CheA